MTLTNEEALLRAAWLAGMTPEGKVIPVPTYSHANRLRMLLYNFKKRRGEEIAQEDSELASAFEECQVVYSKEAGTLTICHKTAAGPLALLAEAMGVALPEAGEIAAKQSARRIEALLHGLPQGEVVDRREDDSVAAPNLSHLLPKDGGKYG